jgi:hypothetical protein
VIKYMKSWQARWSFVINFSLLDMDFRILNFSLVNTNCDSDRMNMLMLVCNDTVSWVWSILNKLLFVTFEPRIIIKRRWKMLQVPYYRWRVGWKCPKKPNQLNYARFVSTRNFLQKSYIPVNHFVIFTCPKRLNGLF